MSIMYLAVPYMHLAAVGKYLYVSAPAVTVAAGLKVEYGLAVGRIADTENDARDVAVSSVVMPSPP